MDLRTMKISNDFPTKANNIIIDFAFVLDINIEIGADRFSLFCFGKEQENNLSKFHYKVLFTYEYTWQNFRLRFLRLVNRLYSVIHKTQKS